MQKLIKQRQGIGRALRQGAAGRSSPTSEARPEIEIIKSFLPQQLSEADTKAAIAEVIAQTGARRHEGHGQSDRGAEGALCRQDGFRARRGGLVKGMLTG